MKPSVGRIVHYTLRLLDMEGLTLKPIVCAALITAVAPRPEPAADAPVEEENGYWVALHIFVGGSSRVMAHQVDRGGVQFTRAAAGTDEAAGCWSWPERI